MRQGISIVIPVYKAEDTIAECLECIRKQTFENWEVIAVIDNSPDTSFEILQSIQNKIGRERINVINSKESLGAASARNVGIEHAQNKLIAFCDADDLWLPHKLEVQYDAYQKTKNPFIFMNYEYMAYDGTRSGKIARVPKTIDYDGSLRNTIIFTSSVMIDTSQFTKEFVRFPNVESEDTALWWKLLKKIPYAMGLDTDVYVLYRKSPGSLSSNKFVALKRIWNLYHLEGFGFLKSCKLFIRYLINTVKRRI